MITESNYPADVRIRQEADTLTEHGHKVTVIALKDDKQSFYETIKGVTVYRLPKIEVFKKSKQRSSKDAGIARKILILLMAIIGYGFEFIYFTLGAFLLSFLVLIREGFDVIHTHNPPDTLFLIALFHKILGKKFVYDHHDLSPELFLEKYGTKGSVVYWLLRFLEWSSCRIADIVIATNESYREIENKRCGVRLEDIYIVRNGPNLQRIRKTNPLKTIRMKAGTILCYLGAINIQDGVQNLLQVLEKLVYYHGYRDVCLLIIGDGDYLYRIREMSSEMKLTNNIYFTGLVTDTDQLNSYLSSADIFLDAAAGSFLNHSSTFIKHMEYMVFGKPVVSFALKESMFSLQDAGIFVEPDNTDEMARVILELINDKEKREATGSKGLARVKTLTWDQVSTPLIKAYQRLAG